MDVSREAQKQPHQKQHVYRTEKIAVFWNPDICINSHRCVQGLPEVFQPSARPRIQVDAASADAIAQVVAQCLSGALHFERLDDGALEEVAEQTTISLQPNGPLYVCGWMRILGPDGTVLREDSRMTLCRFGQSHKKPFCDGSHSTAGFQAE